MIGEKFLRYILGSRKLLVLDSKGLSRSGRPVKGASGKNLALLTLLVENHGEPVDFDELKAHGWPDRYFHDKKAEREAVTGTIYHLRQLLKANDPDEIEFIQKLPTQGYCFIGSVEVVELETPDQRKRGNVEMVDRHVFVADATGNQSELDTIHVHVDGAGALDLIEGFVDEFNHKGWHSSRNTVLGFIEGIQRRDKPRAYGPHTPGGLEAENLAYFSTHLFGNFAATKRELHELLTRLHKTGMDEIVVEAERVIGKLGYPSKEIQWSDIPFSEYATLCSGDVGYKLAEDTEPIEIHYACDIPKQGKWTDVPPFDPNKPQGLQPLVALSSGVGIKVGGWFVFDKEAENKWAYRSNMFETDVNRYRILNDWRKLKRELEKKGHADGYECTVRALIEHSIGIWKTPLKRFSGPRTVEELSEWEKKYPNLREFWVVTPNFLGDKEDPIRDAMTHNLLHRNVRYTYFLRTIADYNRLVSLAEELDGQIGEHTNVWNKIRVVMLVRDASDPMALDKVFAEHGQGCFIANPIPRDAQEEDRDGYLLIKSKDIPGRISGGKLMNREQVTEIIELLKPLAMENSSLQGCQPLQGFCMSLRPQDSKEESGVSVICLGLKELPQLLSDVDDEARAALLREYDLMVATATSQFGGHVARSIEPGYLLIFRKQADALACAEQICKGVNSELAQRVAIDCGDVWRVMRAHGNDYCGKTVTRCRELLRHAKPGRVTMTVFFTDALPRSQSARIVSRGDDHFTFDKKKIRIFELRP